MSETVEWDDLLFKANGGDQEAQNHLCEKLHVRLRPVIKYRLQGWSKQDREDLMQDTLVTFLKKINSVSSNPHQYALIILRNKIGNAIQKRQTATHIPIADEAGLSEDQERIAGEVLSTDESESELLDQLDKKIVLEKIVEAIKELGDFCQTFFMGMLEGHNIGDVWRQSQSLEPNLQRSTFDKRTFDCRKRLRSLVKHRV